MKKILIADDDKEICELLELVLQREGYEVYCVQDGTKAWDTFRQHTFDLVVLDVMMPGIDGYHLAYQMSSYDDGPKPKIILVSSRDAAMDKNIGLKSGAQVQMTKPMNTETLIKKVKELIGT